MKKILVVRFSSIGDIVLTTPVVRCIKATYPEATIHYLTKIVYTSILENNPYIDKVIGMEKEIDTLLPALKAEQYDFIVDLHHNLRTKRLKLALQRKSATFPKLNFQKFILTKLKVNIMPDIHIVDRYFKAVKKIGVQNDGKGLDFFIAQKDQVNPEDFDLPENYVAFAIGAQFCTKRMPVESIIEMVSKIDETVVLLGGAGDMKAGNKIKNYCKNVIDLTGQINLNQSASILQQAKKVISHDTGLMHIAAAFQKPIISIWGNTVPELGMYPYLPEKKSNYSIHEVLDLKCRPCSKIGYQACPKGHFNCMIKQDLNAIAKEVNG